MAATIYQNSYLKIFLNNNKLQLIERGRSELHLQLSNNDITYQNFLEQKIILESYAVNSCISKIKTIYNNANSHLFVVYNGLAKHVMHLYEDLFKMFPLNNNTLKEFVEFISDNFLDTICNTKAYGSALLSIIMLLDHSDPEVYITAAKFAFEEDKNILVSRSHISQGIKLHKNYKNLYVEEFWMELQFLHYTFGQQIPTLQKYKTLLSSSFKYDLDFHFMLLDKIIQTILQFRSDLNDMLGTIVRSMITNFNQDEKMWQILAKMNYEGVIFQFKTQETFYNSDYLFQIKKSIEMYERGLKEILVPEREKKLWELYVEHLINITNSFRMQNSLMRNFMTTKMLEMVEDEKSLPIWSLLMNHMKNKSNFSLDMIKIGAICPYEEINRAIRPSFLEWVSETQSIESGRTLFQELKKIEPKCKVLLLKMIDLENLQTSNNTRHLKRLYSRLCKTFGKNDINVWLDRFEFMFLNARSERAIYHTYKKAKGILQVNLHHALKKEYKKVKSVMNHRIAQN